MVTVHTRVDGAEKTYSDTTEDLVRTGDRSVLVLDGATGLTDTQYSRAESDARWYVERLADEVAARIDDDRSLSETVRAAVEAVATAWEAIKDGADLPPHESPEADVSVLRWDEESVEYLTLGTTRLVLDFGDETRVEQVGGGTELDDRVVEEMAALVDREGEMPYEELVARVYPMLSAHRKLKNRPDGYWICSTDPAVVGHARTGQVDRSALDAAFACTDGFSPLADVFDVFADWHGLLAYCRHNGLDRAIWLLRDIEAADPNCVAYPRLHRTDDAAVALVEFG